jgi:hypothetical protein
VSEQRKTERRDVPRERQDTRDRNDDGQDQGIRRDDRGQEQPADKQRAQKNK